MAAPYAASSSHLTGINAPGGETVRALIKHASGEGNVSIGEMPEPECSDGKVKIEVRFCGVCGTDLHVLHDTFPNYPPVILGHEFSGVVVETGRGVTRVTTGD